MQYNSLSDLSIVKKYKIGLTPAVYIINYFYISEEINLPKISLWLNNHSAILSKDRMDPCKVVLYIPVSFITTSTSKQTLQSSQFLLCVCSQLTLNDKWSKNTSAKNNPILVLNPTLWLVNPSLDPWPWQSLQILIGQKFSCPILPKYFQPLIGWDLLTPFLPT